MSKFLSNQANYHEIQLFNFVYICSALKKYSYGSPTRGMGVSLQLTFRSTEALELDAVVPVFQRVETGVQPETCRLLTLHRGARHHMGALTAVLPLMEAMMESSSIVLFLKHFSTSRSRPWDSFAPPKGNSFPAKGCRPVHI